MKYKLIIFDLDGTLLNTLDDLASSTNYALSSNGLRTVSVEQVREYVGNGIKNLINRAVPEGTDEKKVDEVFNTFKEHYKIHSKDATRPYDGVISAIKRIKDAGGKTAVISNKAHFAVKDLVQIYFDGLFDVAYGERENIMRKPAPDSVNEVLSELGVSRYEAVYIGDSQVDIETANNANMDMIIVDWGFRDRAFLIKHGAKNLASNCDEMLKYIFD